MSKLYKSFLLSFCMLCITALLGQSIEDRLFDLCGVAFKQIETAKGFKSSYKLMVKQPIDHEDEAKGYFMQKVYLNIVDEDSTTVFVTEGYARRSNRIYELTDFIQGNQVTVEHRFFGESIPDSLEYQYLTFAQATTDLHRVNTLLRSILAGIFISTGISKGGTTTIFYRYFYPDDVAVSIPYVAPLNRQLEEKRIYDFLQNKGSLDCRKRILAFQKRLLTNRQYCLDRLSWFSKGRNLEFTYLNPEMAFEYAVLEYPFSLWQWGTNCDDVPNNENSIAEDLDHLIEVSGVDFFADASMKAYASHYYQSGTEMGYYKYEVKEFKGLLPALGDQSNPSAVFAPKQVNLTWDPTLTNKVADWIDNHGNSFIYINGLNDTWSATRVPKSDKVDAIWFNMKDQSHGTARIKNMSDEEKYLLKNSIIRYLNQ